MFPKHGNPGPTGTDFKKNCCKNKKSPAAVQCPELARPERFELPTFWFVARRSIQLSYERVIRRDSDGGAQIIGNPAGMGSG